MNERIKAMQVILSMAAKFYDDYVSDDPEDDSEVWTEQCGIYLGSIGLVKEMIKEAEEADQSSEATIKAAIEVLDQVKPRVASTLVISTAHITTETSDLLDQEKSTTGLSYHRLEGYGFIVWVPTDWFESGHAGFPADLCKIMDYTRNLRCSYVWLDPDAEEIEGLPKYEW